MKEGDIVENASKSNHGLGIFLDIDGIDALLHVSDLHTVGLKPSDLVTIGQNLKVKITKIDKTTNRVSPLSYFTEDPYENLLKNLR